MIILELQSGFRETLFPRAPVTNGPSANYREFRRESRSRDDPFALRGEPSSRTFVASRHESSSRVVTRAFVATTRDDDSPRVVANFRHE